MAAKQSSYEPVQPVDDLAGRAERARRYMVKMVQSANAGLLAEETLWGLQRPSPGAPEPRMVLRKDGDGLWQAVEWCEPDVVLTPEPVTKPAPSVTKPADVTKPDVEFRDTSRGGRPAVGDRPMTAAERKRAQRARERGEDA